MNFAMSTVKVELEYLSPEGFRYEQTSNSDFTLTSLTELSGDSSQLELPHSSSFPAGKPNFTLIFFNILYLYFFNVRYGKSKSQCHLLCGGIAAANFCFLSYIFPKFVNRFLQKEQDFASRVKRQKTNSENSKEC